MRINDFSYMVTKLYENMLFLLIFHFILYSFVCLSETCPDSKILPDDDNLDTSGYNLVRCDYSSNSGGGVCFYHKKVLPLRVVDVNYLNDCIRFELKIGEKLFSFISLYRSSSQITLN